MKKVFALILLILIAFGFYQIFSVSNLFSLDNQKLRERDNVKFSDTKPIPISSISLTKIADNLYVPWSLVFTSDSRILVTERNGTIRQITHNTLTTDPLIAFPDITSSDEAGLMGMTIDPKYEINKYLYVCMAYTHNNTMYNKIIRLKDAGDKLLQDVILIDSIPSARFHAGCRLSIGPDQKLYVTTGDASIKNLAQNIDSLAGKILRLNLDGTIPSDNPFEFSYVYTYGHRNPQGIAWHPDTGYMYSTEHGPSGFDGPEGGDEINFIQKGKNYGWPVVSHKNSAKGMVDPIVTFTPAEAPASGMFYSGKKESRIANNFFFGALRGEGIIRIVFDEKDPKNILYEQKVDLGIGRIRDIEESPEGDIYVSTSNRDGRGTLRKNDDKVYKLTFAFEE